MAWVVVWEETQVDTQLIGGHFSVLLGQVTLLESMDWSEPCWLSVQVNGESELLPRHRITSVPLAIRAGSADGMMTPGLTDDANSLVPSGAVLMWTGTTCPSGYTRFSALDGRFLIAGPTYNAAAGGSNTHTHGPGGYTTLSHNHGGATGSGGNVMPGKGQVDHQSNLHPHTHSIPTQGAQSINGTSGSANSRPKFSTILLCQRG